MITADTQKNESNATSQKCIIERNTKPKMFQLFSIFANRDWLFFNNLMAA